MPEISVIVPVYNARNFIKRCYESIINQSFKDFEIIFVDDGSTDDSLSVLKSFKDERVKIITQENKKQGGARNEGIKQSEGKYISFVDADDFISEDFLEGLYNTTIKSNADITVSSVIRYKNRKNQKYMLQYFDENTYENLNDKVKIAYKSGVGRSVWNKLYRKDFLLNNNLFFRENVFYEDPDFTAKAVYYSNKIASTNVGNYFYFVNNNSTIRKSPDKKKQEDKYKGLKLTYEFEISKKMSEGGIINKFDYSIFGINLFRIKEKINENENIEEGFLFDFIKIYSKKI